MKQIFIVLFLCLATPLLAAKDPCRGFLALQTADAALKAGTLTPERLARLLAKVNPSAFSAEDRPVVAALLRKDPVTLKGFSHWTRIGTPYLKARLSHCRRPDPDQPVRGNVDPPRPGNAEDHQDQGAPVKDRKAFELDVLVWSAAAGVSMLGLGFALVGPIARHLRRRRRRFLCSLDVYLSSAAGAGDGQVLDISLVGAKVRKGAFPAEVGDRVQMSTDAFHATAHVIWCNAHYLGVRFREPLSMDQVKRAIASHPKKARRFSKIGSSAEV